jgi:hypothetical protein
MGIVILRKKRVVKGKANFGLRIRPSPIPNPVLSDANLHLVSAERAHNGACSFATSSNLLALLVL